MTWGRATQERFGVGESFCSEALLGKMEKNSGTEKHGTRLEKKNIIDATNGKSKRESSCRPQSHFSSREERFKKITCGTNSSPNLSLKKKTTSEANEPPGTQRTVLSLTGLRGDLSFASMELRRTQ